MVNLIKFFPSVADRVPNIEKLKGKKVLVTGASGLIGNNVLTTLNNVGADISIVQHKTYPYLTKNITLLKWPISGKFDYIFHLAGYGQPVMFSIDKPTTIDINTTMLVGLVSHLKENGSILFASTSEVYSGLNIEATEDMIGLTTGNHTRAPYIESKLCGEEFVSNLNPNYNGKVARISLAYGPGVKYNDTRVMSDFIRMGLEYKLISPRGGLNSMRTYCFVSDTVTMLFNILLNGKEVVYNVGGESSMTLRDLLYAIAYKTNAKIKFPDSDDTEGAPTFVGMCTDKYYSEFPDMQFTDFDIGLDYTIAWFRYLRGE